MLKVLNKKICPILTIALATLGCGKQITEDSPEEINVVENQELPAALVINLNSNDNQSTLYEIPQNANIVMPDYLKISGPDSKTKTVVISYNYDVESQLFDYQCVYKSIPNQVDLFLYNCNDNYGSTLSEVTNFEFPIYYAKFIKVELIEKTQDISVSAIFNVDWK